MSRTGEGLTKTYNRFNDPDEDSADLSGYASCTAR